jgi:hypothetical protein
MERRSLNDERGGGGCWSVVAVEVVVAADDEGFFGKYINQIV